MPFFTQPAIKIEYDFELHFSPPRPLNQFREIVSPVWDDNGVHTFSGIAVAVASEGTCTKQTIYFKAYPKID